MRIANQTAEQYKTGSVQAVQMHEGDSIIRVFNSPAGNTNPFDFLAGMRGCFEMGFNNGYFGFLKYSEEEDTEWQTPFKFDSTNTATNGSSAYPPTAGFLVAVISAVDSTGNGRGQVTLTFNFNVEYLTLDPWTAVDIPRTTPEDHEVANEILSSMNQHYENPIHWDKILATIGKVARIGSRALAVIPHPIAQAASRVSSTVADVAGQ